MADVLKLLFFENLSLILKCLFIRRKLMNKFLLFYITENLQRT